jgi:hypothetical protein
MEARCGGSLAQQHFAERTRVLWHTGRIGPLELGERRKPALAAAKRVATVEREKEHAAKRPGVDLGAELERRVEIDLLRCAIGGRGVALNVVLGVGDLARGARRVVPVVALPKSQSLT